MPTKQSFLGIGSVAMVLSIMVTSCKSPSSHVAQSSPLHESAWTERPGNLGEWGHGSGHIYGTLGKPESKKGALVVWRWRGDSLEEAAFSPIPWSINVVPSMEGKCGLSLGRESGAWPYAIVTPTDGKILKEWSITDGWWTRVAGGSTNGRYISMVVKEEVRDRAKVALIDVETCELKWVADLNGHGSGTIRRVVVTNDGRYIAVAGWNNGTAMIDVKAGKVLWAKRPEGEVSTGYAAFAPDGKTIYTAGSEGCVYSIEVATGNVVAQRWATLTGESEYAHRVSALALSDDGKWLAAGTGPEGEVYAWNLEDDKKTVVFNHGNGSILIVAFSPDSKHLASVGDGTLKVWSLKSSNK